ncbi:MAG: dTDP-4-dehydrorhamnose 3,5-epimerase [Chloroflexi bacterium]|nr:dTDP-4-dehydrorhamnose 3,5-epimerase [Chloroflexota bacterium]
MPFTFVKQEIGGVILVQPQVFEDGRGFFLETYKMSDFAEAGIERLFVQDNHSRSIKGTLRGLHYQKPPFEQGKLVRALRGKVFDVVVDIRKDSSTFGQWLGVTLSDKNKSMLYIPEGFAHGFMVLSDTADLLYKTTNVYSPEHESGIIWNDPDLNIAWPIEEPIMTDRDTKWPTLKKAGIQ